VNSCEERCPQSSAVHVNVIWRRGSSLNVSAEGDEVVDGGERAGVSGSGALEVEEVDDDEGEGGVEVRREMVVCSPREAEAGRKCAWKAARLQTCRAGAGVGRASRAARRTEEEENRCIISAEDDGECEGQRRMTLSEVRDGENAQCHRVTRLIPLDLNFNLLQLRFTTCNRDGYASVLIDGFIHDLRLNHPDLQYMICDY
jgi:hypothetical protein